MNSLSTFNPNWYSAPGNSIVDILKVKNISKTELSVKMELSLSSLDDLLNGYSSIDKEIASKLSENVGGTVDFWLKREEKYRLDLNRIENTKEKNLLSNFDIKYVEKVLDTEIEKKGGQGFLDFFSVPDFPSWEKKYENLFTTTYFKKSKTYRADKVALATWLRVGELCTKNIEVREWDREKLFNSIDEIKELTKEKSPSIFLPKLKEIFADCGVKFVVLKTPSKCPINGAIRFVEKNQPLLILSFRYKTDDHFWFTIFHEIGHLLLHDFDQLYLERDDFKKQINDIEREANKFSETVLLSGLDKRELEKIPRNHKEIIRKAVQLDISPGILVGQMQFQEVISYRYYNKLKRKYSWDDLSFIQ
ncbi:MAG: ImmA/IrrE family metallo-endopeptidase [Candidatus Paceibacterota bacterium]